MVKQWNVKNISQKCSVLVIGKRNRGKSTLMVDIFRYIKAPKAIVLSATDKCSHFYEQYFPEKFIYAEYDQEILIKLVQSQKKAVQKNPHMNKSGLLLVIDDTGFDKKFLKSKILSEILMNGRWYNISVVIGVQDAASIPLALRAQMDYVCALSENFKCNQERLYNWFFGVYNDFRTFRHAFLTCTSNYGVMVLDNVCKDITSEKTIFWYKANPKVRYRYGSREYQQL